MIMGCYYECISKIGQRVPEVTVCTACIQQLRIIGKQVKILRDLVTVSKEHKMLFATGLLEGWEGIFM